MTPATCSGRPLLKARQRTSGNGWVAVVTEKQHQCLYIPGNGKALIKLRNKTGNCLLAASQNRGPLKVFQLKETVRTIPVNATDISATLFFADGRKQKQELYYGASFLSQSGRFITAGKNVNGIEISDSRGNTRRIQLK